MTETSVVERPIGFAEFIALIATLTAMVAMSIDVILPALADIDADLAADNPNDRQLTITMFILGMAFSQVVYGPLSDSFGRRFGIFLGLGIYLAGTALCLMSDTLPALIFGRIVQGIGAAGPRIVANAIVRDRYSGRSMAQISSLVMMVFMLVPVFAPLLGQGILTVATWRGIFWFLAFFAVFAFVWSATRLEETLSPSARRPFRAGPIFEALKLIVSNRLAVGCTLALSFFFSAFLAFLSSSQQILGEAYGLDDWFPLTFSGMAIVIGFAAAINARLVMRYGMQRLSSVGTIGVAVISFIFVAWSQVVGMPPLWFTLFWLCIAMGSIGIISGNLNAMAMEPLGAVAGVAAGAIGSVSALISAIIASFIAGQYDGTAQPIALGFLVCSLIALALLRWATKERVRRVL